MLIGGVIISAQMGAELKRLRSVDVENTQLRVENQRVRQLEHEVVRLDDFRRRVLALASAGVGTEIETSLEAPRIDATTSDKQGGGAAKDGMAEEGTAEAAARKAEALPRARWPVEGVVSRSYEVGSTPDREHHGIDIAAPHGTPVLAAWPGVVAFTGVDSVFGQLVIVDHGDDLQSLYGHNSMMVVGMGDWVRGGQEIARVGSTGSSSAPHVHFELRYAGNPVDPRPHLMR
jgi:murein DD-endopeptidase MepM/ murein hydrolase activator NlpD